MLAFLISVCTVLACLNRLDGYGLNIWIYIFAAALVVFSRISYKKDRRIFYVAWLIASLITVIVVISRHTELISSAKRFIGGSGGERIIYTLFPFVLFLTYWLDLVIQKHTFSNVLTLVLILTLPIFFDGGHILITILLILCRIIISVTVISSDTISHIKAVSAACIVFAVLGILSGAALYYIGDSVFDAAYSAEEAMYRAYTAVIGERSDTIQGGKISRRNNYQNGREQLTVMVTREPSERLYLRGFVGGRYSGGEWSASDDGSILEEILEEYPDGWGILGISSLYSSMYYTLNSCMDDELIPPPVSLSVNYTNIDGMNYYVPYYGTVETIYVYGGYRYRFYEKSDIRIDRENVSESFSGRAAQCFNLQSIYREYAEDEYTGVPRSQVPRLAQLCADNPLNTLDEITAFILSVLENNTEYSTSPGWSPKDTDVVENFLFDRKSGYCVHYASAAALMYRLYGIPARYATGYMIEPSEFTRSDYGTFTASVSDRYAHAWVEIWIDNYGWTPIEVTPSVRAGGEVYPGYNSIELADKVKQAAQSGMEINVLPSLGNRSSSSRTDMGNNTLDTSDSDTDAANSEDTNSDGNAENDASSTRDDVGVVLSLIVAGLIAVLAYALIRRRYKRSCRTEFWRLINILSIALDTEYDGYEPELCSVILECTDAASEDEVQKMLDIVKSDAFGKYSISEEENKQAQKICRCISSGIFKTLSISKKLKTIR